MKTDRTELVGVFIPDVIKVDLSTAPARLPGGDGDNEGYHRLGIFESDVLFSFKSSHQHAFRVTDSEGNAIVDDVSDRRHHLPLFVASEYLFVPLEQEKVIGSQRVESTSKAGFS